MEGWKTLRVADVAARNSNALATGPFGSSIGAKFFRSFGVPIIRGGNLSADPAIRIDEEDLVFLAPKKAKEFSRSIVRSGDLIFTSWGTINQVGLIDKSASFDEYIISNKQMKLTPNPQIASPEFLYYLFSGPAMQREILEGAIGSSIPGFNLTRLRSIEIQMPPIREQVKIARALSDAEFLETTLHKMIAKKEAIKRGLMQQLLTGCTRLPSFSGQWQPFTFEQLAQPVRDRIHPRNALPGTRLIELEHIESGGRLLGSSTARHAASLKAVFRPGDVLFGKLRAYLRKYWLADSPGICSTEIWALRSTGRTLGEYIRYLVETDRFIEIASGGYGTHMPRADWKLLRSLTFEIPEIKEQAAIAAALRDVDSEIAMLHTRRAKAQEVKQGMMQQLLTGRTRLPI